METETMSQSAPKRIDTVTTFAQNSPEEHERIKSEVDNSNDYCVDESAEFVEEHLQLLSDELRKLHTPARESFDLAMKLNPEYVNSKDFRLMFLRADQFNASRAARRMAEHFDFKLELFGVNKLGRPITFQDLNDDDRVCLMTGFIQFLGHKDNNRPVGLVGGRYVWLPGYSYVRNP